MQTPQKYDRSPLKLWSPLQRHIADHSQRKGTPQQWIGTIRNWQKKGVSSVEIEWSRIIPMLESHRAPFIGIDEVLAFLGDRPPCELVLQREVTNRYEPLVHYEKQQRPARIVANWFPSGRREARLLHYRDRSFGICIWLHTDWDLGFFGRHSYWSITIPRGKKKLSPHWTARDFANLRFATLREAMIAGQKLVTRMARRLASEGFVGQLKSVNRYADYVLSGGEQYTEWLITAPNLPVEYWSDHFGLANIVAHVRTTDRTTPEGERMLVLEEIQSDWNQALREAIQELRRRNATDEEDIDLIEWDEGIDRPPLNPYRNHWLEAALRQVLLLAANQGAAGIAWLPGSFHAERFPWANADGLTIFYDRIVPAAVDKLAQAWGVTLGLAQFSTLSRRFAVRRATGTGRWHVVNLESLQSVGDFSDRHEAEVSRRSKEEPVVESVPALYISDEMRADLMKIGLPYLGAVGKRSGSTLLLSRGKDRNGQVV
jgi:hypothetical protein